MNLVYVMLHVSDMEKSEPRKTTKVCCEALSFICKRLYCVKKLPGDQVLEVLVACCLSQLLGHPVSDENRDQVKSKVYRWLLHAGKQPNKKLLQELFVSFFPA